jgi:hypothetical protein
MRMMIRYESGLTVEGVLLAANSWQMRLAIAAQGDTVELIRVDRSWCTDRGEIIEIEALMAIPGTDVSHFCADVSSRTDVAGRAFTGF